MVVYVKGGQHRNRSESDFFGDLRYLIQSACIGPLSAIGLTGGGNNGIDTM